MGCWNGTCGVSRLPLFAGEPVIAFPLLQGFTEGDLGGGFCYPYDRAQPLTIGIRGVYNDYGGIEDLRGETLPQVTRFFSENAEKYLDAEGAPVDLEYSDLETVLNDGIERGELYNSDINYGSNKPYYRQLGLMLVHEGLHDKLVAQMGAQVSWRYPDKTVRDIYEEPLRALMVKPKKAVKGKDAKLEQAMRDVKLMQSCGILGNLTAKYGRFTRHFIEDAKNASTPMQEELLKTVVDLLLFNAALTSLRTPWSIQCGAGMQEGYSPLHRTLVQDMADRVVAHEAENEEDE